MKLSHLDNSGNSRTNGCQDADIPSPKVGIYQIKTNLLSSDKDFLSSKVMKGITKECYV